MGGLLQLSAQVRRAGTRELPWLVPLGFSFYEEAGLRGRFVPEVFVRHWRAWLRAGVGRLHVLELAGAVVGGIGALIGPDPCDGVLGAQEMFWFVAREARGCGLALLQALEDGLHAEGVRRLTMIHLEALEAGRLKRLYERRGYAALETWYSKEL